MSRTLFAGAIDRKLNIIVSAQSGYDVVTSTLDELRQVCGSILLFDELSVHGDLIRVNDAETIVFDALHQANADFQSVAAELMAYRSLGGLKLPNLKSVVAFFGHDDGDDIALAAGYADLAPSLSMAWE